MIIKPIGQRLVLKELHKEEKTSSGIIMPDSAVEKPDFAEVVDLSKDLDTDLIKKGDKVLYTKYKGTKLKDGDDNYIVIDFEDVLAVVEE